MGVTTLSNKWWLVYQGLFPKKCFDTSAFVLLWNFLDVAFLFPPLTIGFAGGIQNKGFPPKYQQQW